MPMGMAMAMAKRRKVPQRTGKRLKIYEVA
jgi:hypothetical protein